MPRLEADLEGPKPDDFPMQVLIAHATNAFSAKIEESAKELRDLVTMEKKFFESDDVDQSMYDHIMVMARLHMMCGSASH
eukprot:SAG11_NODE_93_length_17080_cov_10.504093_2_plen_80_part_00